MPLPDGEFLLAEQILQHQTVLSADHVEIVALEEFLLVQLIRLSACGTPSAASLPEVLEAVVLVDNLGELSEILSVQLVRLATGGELDVAHGYQRVLPAVARHVPAGQGVQSGKTKYLAEGGTESLSEEEGGERGGNDVAVGIKYYCG